MLVIVLKRSWPVVAHCIIGDNTKQSEHINFNLSYLTRLRTTYNLEFDSFSILFDSVDFLQKIITKFTTSNDFSHNQLMSGKRLTKSTPMVLT